MTDTTTTNTEVTELRAELEYERRTRFEYDERHAEQVYQLRAEVDRLVRQRDMALREAYRLRSQPTWREAITALRDEAAFMAWTRSLPPRVWEAMGANPEIAAAYLSARIGGQP